MKHLFSFSLFFLFTFGLFSQDAPPETTRKEEVTKDKFFFTFKNAWTTYIPVEAVNVIGNDVFSRVSADNLGNYIYTAKQLKNNQSEINPFSFTYYNANQNLFFELSRYKLTLNDAYLEPDEPLRLYARTPFNNNLKLPNIKREETKLDIYKSYSITENNTLYYGLGIRNISKSANQREFAPFNAETIEKYNTTGLSFYLKYVFKFSENWKFNFLLQPFYTYGTKSNKDPIRIFTSRNNFLIESPYQYYSITLRENNQTARIYGSELDISFSYQINENLDLSFGGNLIYSKFILRNTGNLNLGFDKNGKLLPLEPFVNNFYNIERRLVQKLFTNELLYSYYLGINLKF